MAEVGIETLGEHIVSLEDRIKSLLGTKSTFEKTANVETPEELKIKSDYAIWLTEQKKKVTTRRILKSKQCYSKLITKKNLPVFDFDKLSPKKLPMTFPKSSPIAPIVVPVENPFKPSPERDPSRKSRVTGAFEEGSWQLQSPCFGKKPEIDIIVDSDSDRGSSVAFIEKRVFKPVNQWPRKAERGNRQQQKWGWAK
jgi:hypothetical protein